MIGSIALYKNKILRMIYARKEGIHPSAVKNLEVMEHIDRNTLIDETKYVVIDTELTGLDLKKGSIVSIGAVKMVGGRIDLGDIFYRLVNPETELTGQSIVIHGITPSEVVEMPEIDTALSEFLDFCGNDIIVGHFVSIDLNFINREMKRLYGFTVQNPAVDTYMIHEWMRQNDGDFSRHYGGMSEDADLFSIANKYRIPVSSAHNALNDAFVTAQLFQRFISFLPRFGVNTLGDLLRIGKP